MKIKNEAIRALRLPAVTLYRDRETPEERYFVHHLIRTLNPQHGILTFVSHENPDHVFLLDLTRDTLVPYVFTEGSQVWSFVLAE